MARRASVISALYFSGVARPSPTSFASPHTLASVPRSRGSVVGPRVASGAARPVALAAGAGTPLSAPTGRSLDQAIDTNRVASTPTPAPSAAGSDSNEPDSKLSQNTTRNDADYERHGRALAKLLLRWRLNSDSIRVAPLSFHSFI